MFDSIALWVAIVPKHNQQKLVLLVRQDAIGDFVMWLDTAKEYRNIFPPDKYKIVLAGNKIWCDLAEELPYWDEILMVDVKQFKTFSRYRWDFLRKVRNLGVQISIQPTFSREFYQGDALVRASDALRRQGATAVHAACTHGLFTAGAISRLANHVDGVHSSDSLPNPRAVVSSAPALARGLRNLMS